MTSYNQVEDKSAENRGILMTDRFRVFLIVIIIIINEYWKTIKHVVIF
jgi:hypothetical protein